VVSHRGRKLLKTARVRRPQAQGNFPSFLKGRHADFARAAGPNPVGNRFAPFTEKKRFFVYLEPLPS
jgi:hypothetical protein